MDSVIMTTPGHMRLRSRLRTAANQLCARSSKRSVFTNKVHCNHHRGGNSVNARHLVNRNNNNNVNNVQNPRVINNQLISTPARFLNRNNIAREVYNAWCGRLGDVTRIPSDSVQALFNDMQLYPSKNQVVEMLQCARQCGRRNTSQFLTFGEFCVFAGELRRGGRLRQPVQHSNHHKNQVQRSTKPLSHCEVFLGGSCNPTTWRADIAIPTLSKHGITYYNPQVSAWAPELMAAEHDAKESATLLFFVVDSQTRCVAGMLEVAHLVAKKRCLVLVVHPFAAGQSIMGETLSAQEYVDLSEGQSALLTLVKSQGVTVHNNLTSALQFTVNILRGSDGIHVERKLTDKLMKLREVFDSVDRNHTGFLSLSDVSLAYYHLTNSQLRISDLSAIMGMSQHQRTDNRDEPEDVQISFEQFCGIVAEFTTTDGCGAVSNNSTLDEGAHRFTNPLYWKLAILRTQQLLRIYIVQPIVQIIDWINQPLQRQSSANNNSNFEYVNGHQNGTHTNNYTLSNGHNNERYDVYLGGSCMKRTTWRQKIAIPLLKRYGVTYYNPSLHEKLSSSVIENFLSENENGNDTSHLELNGNSTSIVRSASRSLLEDLSVMNESKIVLFVITNETRSITSMILAAYYIALKKNVVLCVQQLVLDDCVVGSDTLTKQAIKDYNRARAYLSDLAKHENVPIFETVQEAVQCAVDLLQQQQR